MKLLTSNEVAERLGVHRSRVHVLIKDGRLPAQRFGRAYMVSESDLSLVANRTTGRPPKAKAEASTIVDKPNRTTKKATAKKGGK
jgi:excisionase family DNA binding protein